MAEYVIWLCSPFGERLELIKDWYRLEYTRVLTDVGQLHVEATGWPGVPLRRDMRLAVYRDGLLEGVYLLSYVRRDHVRGTVQLKAMGPNDLLRRRVVAYHKDTAQGAKSGAADTVMYEIVKENLGDAAGVRSVGPYLEVLPPQGVGPTVNVTVAWKNVLKALREIFDMTVQAGTPVFFGLWAPSETRFVFETRPTLWGRDRRLVTTEQVTFSVELGTAANVQDEMDWSQEVSVAYALGSGRDRPTVSEAENTAVLNENPFARVEEVVNAASEDGEASLADQAQAALAKKRRVYRQYADIVSTSRVPYRRAWDVGDAVTVVSEAMHFDAVIEAVHVKVADKEEIKPKLVRYG